MLMTRVRTLTSLLTILFAGLNSQTIQAASYQLNVVAPGMVTPTCALPWGGKLINYASVMAYATNTVPYGQTCLSESRQCVNGSLSGSYPFASCSVEALATGTLSANTSTDFGNVSQGGTVTRTFTFRNTGTRTLSIYSAVSGADFSIQNNTCGSNSTPLSLAVGATCTLDVKYTAAVTGDVTGNLSVQGDFTSSPTSLSLTARSLALGQIVYGSAGTYSWTVPAGVYSISVVAVGGGAGGGGVTNSVGPAGSGGTGGSLMYSNNLSVTPGETLTVKVGAGGYGSASYTGSAGVTSSLLRNTTKLVAAPGGGSGDASLGTGGAGGAGGGAAGRYAGGGGGAGGYSGYGGTGSNCYGSTTSGTGGGGGGGACTDIMAGSGGGVGLLGQGTSGNKGVASGESGQPGSGGSGIQYGGGGGAAGLAYTTAQGYQGGGGAIRIIYPGTTRYFPLNAN